MMSSAEFFETIQAILDGVVAVESLKIIPEPEPRDRVPQFGTITPSELAVRVHLAIRDRWPATADSVVVRCEWNDAKPWNPRLFFFHADTGAPIHFLPTLHDLLEPSLA